MNECGTFVLFIKFLFVFKNIEIWFGVIVIFKIFSLDEVFFLSHPKQTFIRIYTITILCEFSAQLLCQCLHAAWLYFCLCFTTITKVNRKRLKHKLDHNRPIYNVKIMWWFWICCYLNAVSQACSSLFLVLLFALVCLLTVRWINYNIKIQMKNAQNCRLILMRSCMNVCDSQPWSR